MALFDLFRSKKKNEPFTDTRDGKVYKTVKIGNQVWMAENLAYKQSKGNCWAYKDDENNVAKYGYLYDWQSAKKAAPKGWHLPTKEEWETLYSFLGNDGEIVFNAVKEGGSSGFNALFGGSREVASENEASFYGMDLYSNFWSSTVYDDNYAWYFGCNSEYNEALMSNMYRKVFGYNVRLIRD